jgi:hypothetical protein
VTLARVAIGTFMLFYGAAEAIAGIATGTLVQYASDLPRMRRPRRPVPCRPSGTTSSPATCYS